MAGGTTLHHYWCPRCTRLCSKPWRPPVFCLCHDSSFIPYEIDDDDAILMEELDPDAIQGHLHALLKNPPYYDGQRRKNDQGLWEEYIGNTWVILPTPIYDNVA